MSILKEGFQMTDDYFPMTIPAGCRHGFFPSVLMPIDFERCIFEFKIES
jgi:hypothetical protein